jgi:hypothetical protein
MAIVTDRYYESGFSYLDVTYDDATYNTNRQSYRILSAKAHNGTDQDTYPGAKPRDIKFWATYKGTRFEQVVPPGQDFVYTPTGNRQTADITEIGIS